MKKIFTSSQIKELDAYTIKNEPIQSIDLMERAANALTNAITEEWNDLTPVVVFAGPGNNGGDALAVARMLSKKEYEVEVFLFNPKNNLSADCEENKKRLLECQMVKSFVEVTATFDPPKLGKNALVVDGLFGSGLKKPLDGGFASLVKYINQSGAKVVSIDMPSGMMAERNDYSMNPAIVKAYLTLTLQQKKLAMMFADSSHYLGRVKVLGIRLSQEKIEKMDSHYSIVEENDIEHLLPKRDAFAHKGMMGNALLIAGSYGMAGASVLAARACLRAGIGKVTVRIPRRNYDIMQISVPEAVLSIDKDDKAFTQPVTQCRFDAVGIGPGLGIDEDTAIAMIDQLRQTRCPTVLDADALNILASHKAWMSQLPDGLIMTPHPAEFDRVAGPSANCYDRLSKARDMAMQLHAYIILKGHRSALCKPDGSIIFNTTGNPGMATAGSGDVLTGIITALLGRGCNRSQACLLGMYLHGLAGDMAAKHIGMESLVASDIIKFLPTAFKIINE